METENFLIEFGLRVKKARLKLNMSQEELAKKSGYSSRSTINKIELGTNGVPQTKVQAIASALGVSPAYLMGWDEEAPQEEKKPHTIAAHATEDLDEEDIEEIYRFIDYIKSKKKK